MVLYKTQVQLNKAGYVPTPGALKFENALFTPELVEELGLNKTQFEQDEEGNFLVTIMLVTVDGWTSKAGNKYDKGTCFVLPQR